MSMVAANDAFRKFPSTTLTMSQLRWSNPALGRGGRAADG